MQPPGAPSVLFLSGFRDESEMYEEYLRLVGLRVRVVTDEQAAAVKLRFKPTSKSSACSHQWW